MTAEDLLLRLRACARRRDLPTLSELTDSRGSTFLLAYQALVHAGYYSAEARKSWLSAIDSAIKSVEASDA